MIRVSDLVAHPSLELEVLSGAAGLGRPVTWTHVSEILDVASFLEGGELLLTTGLGIPVEEAAQVEYLETLADARAAGLGIGHRAPPLSAAMLAASDLFEIPLMRVGVQVPFSLIGRTVAAANHELSQSRLTLQVRILESLRLWADGQIDSPSSFQGLESITGFDIYLVSESGSALIPGMKAAPAAVRREIAGLRESPRITNGYGAPVPIQSPDTAYVVLQHRSDDGATGVIVARQVATVAAVHLSDHYRRRAEEFRQGSEVLGRLLRGEAADANTQAFLTTRRFDVDGAYRLMAIRPSDGSRPVEAQRLQADLIQMGTPALIIANPNHIILLVNSDLSRLGPALTARGWNGGVSEPAALSADLARCHRQALWALENSELLGDELVEYGSARELTPWLSMSPEAISAVLDRVLGPILQHDRARGSELMHTLERYLQLDRSPSRAARDLDIHPHTLRYRLDKIEELTAKSMSRTQDVAEFWWAVQARCLPI